jgi:hypothetical protein
MVGLELTVQRAQEATQRTRDRNKTIVRCTNCTNTKVARATDGTDGTAGLGKAGLVYINQTLLSLFEGRGYSQLYSLQYLSIHCYIYLTCYLLPNPETLG